MTQDNGLAIRYANPCVNAGPSGEPLERSGLLEERHKRISASKDFGEAQP